MAEPSTEVIQLEGIGEFRHAAVELVSRAIRQLRILSYDLEPHLWGDEQVVDVLKQFALSNKKAQIEILLQSTKSAVTQSHPLINLTRRLPSRMAIRVINEEYQPMKPISGGFLLVDRQGVMFRTDHQHYRGFAHHNDATTVQRLQDEFAELWRYSHVSPEFRQLNL
jgi:hypothetical protein